MRGSELSHSCACTFIGARGYLRWSAPVFGFGSAGAPGTGRARRASWLAAARAAGTERTVAGRTAAGRTVAGRTVAGRTAAGRTVEGRAATGRTDAGRAAAARVGVGEGRGRLTGTSRGG